MASFVIINVFHSKKIQKKQQKKPKMILRNRLSQIWGNIQYKLFPMLEEEIGPLSQKHKKLISILELIRIEQFIPDQKGKVGRPSKDRVAIARAFVAKSVLHLSFTNQLIDYLKSDKHLRLICGWQWECKWHIPSEATFSRAFEEFAKSNLPETVHKALIKDLYADEIVGHIIKDSTPISSRERPLKKKNKKKEPKKNGRPKKGEVREKPRIQRQKDMSIEEMLEDLPKACDFGKKKSANGNMIVWKGYKLHSAVDGHCVPLAAIVTSASLHDSQAGIPLAAKANEVCKSLYDLMDSAYNVEGIIEHSQSLGHVPIVGAWSKNSEEKAAKEVEDKKRKILSWKPAEEIRYQERGKAERFNALFKDYFGGLTVRVKGHLKVSCHLIFGVLSLAALVLLNLV